MPHAGEHHRMYGLRSRAVTRNFAPETLLRGPRVCMPTCSQRLIKALIIGLSFAWSLSCFYGLVILVVRRRRAEFLAKIAVIPESPTAHVLASGEGWTVSEIVCTLSPRDRPFEERHSCTSIAIVVAGTFQYRSQNACELMTPGSLLLGNAGQYFECGHEHGSGDRCISFSYTPEWIERLAIEAGVRDVRTVFKTLRLPAIRDLSPVIAAAVTGLKDLLKRPGGK